MSLITFTPKGIYCQQGDFYIDPWEGVNKAIITHAHSDHAYPGSKHYMCTLSTLPIMKYRLGSHIAAQGVPYEVEVDINGVKVSFHPAGHIIGSAQVRCEYKGEVWVISGDYKTTPDGLCEPFEPVKCHHFVTESTFGLPVFAWEDDKALAHKINTWWSSNAVNGVTSLIGAYSLGKAQRLMHLVDNSIGPILTHAAVENTNEVLRKQGIALKPTTLVNLTAKQHPNNALVIAPPSSLNSTWANRFKNRSTAIASGWMAIRGHRRRRNVENGFIVSDHADWQGLLDAIKATEAQNIYVTHGYTSIFSKYLQEIGYNAYIVQTKFGESEEVE